jgi:hypothetical protein
MSQDQQAYTAPQKIVGRPNKQRTLDVASEVNNVHAPTTIINNNNINFYQGSTANGQLPINQQALL